MSVLTAPSQPTHRVGGAEFTSLATPSRGTNDLSVWLVEIAPDTPATPHALSREEIFVVLAGVASVGIDDSVNEAHAGDAIVVPPGRQLALTNAGPSVLRLLCCMTVGGQAMLGDGTVLTPPWSQ